MNSAGAEANERSESPALSADGRLVAFYSAASNLVPGDTNGQGDVFVHDLAPRCDIQMSQASYADGQTVIADVFRLANPFVDAGAVEWKVWLTLAGFYPLSVVNVGAGGSLVLPSGFDYDYGPLPLFAVSPAHPRGSYGFDCRLLDPVTGATVSLDENPFEVQ